eukprot:scaffold70775_cov20-Tisochrysis_lutea.AAC.1
MGLACIVAGRNENSGQEHTAEPNQSRAIKSIRAATLLFPLEGEPLRSDTLRPQAGLAVCIVLEE